MTDIEYTPPVTENVETDYYLKFADEAQANTVLEGLEGYSIDVIGVIYKDSGLTDAEGNAIMVDLEGWHVNLRGAMTDAFDAYKVIPTQPYRVWA
jgi:hypothetical protein